MRPPVFDPVAALSNTNVVPSVMLAIRVPSGMLVPVTNIPTLRLVVEQVTVVELFVVVGEAIVTPATAMLESVKPFMAVAKLAAVPDVVLLTS